MRAIAFLVALSMVLLSTAALADVPGLINYQGTLTDTNGVALDTTVSMAFSIYTDSTGGTQVWTENQTGVVVSHGLFNVLLGRVNSISDTVFKDPDRWLGVQVGTDAELQPRERIASVGYSLKAADAQSGGGWTDDGTVVRLTTVTDSVGVGTASPAEKLHVVGNTRIDGLGEMTGFKMPTGADAGYVLTSDAAGVGTWQAPAAAVADSDWIISGSDMYSGVIGNVGIGTPSPTARLEVLATANTAVYGESGTGSGVFGVSESSDGVTGMSTSGYAGAFYGGNGVFMVASQSNGMEIASPTGHGINVLLNPGNPNDGVHSAISGPGAAVKGENDDGVGVMGISTSPAHAAVEGTGEDIGIRGFSTNGTGVEGTSDNHIGVEGMSTNHTGVEGWSQSNTGYGVRGVNDSDEGDGIWGESVGGDGVYGFSGSGIGVEGGSNSGIGVYGSSIESTGVEGWSLEHIAVFGHSDTCVANWGESFHKVGVVGTAGQPLGLSSIADSAGVYGYSDISYGVIGEADLDDSSKAGVQAIGDGVNAFGDPRAAALEIRDGAVKVSGPNRPAGTLTFTPVWTSQTDEPVQVFCTCEGCVHGVHSHIYYYWDTTMLMNSLIVPDSIILLTVEASEPMFAQVLAKGLGVANIMVTCVTPPFPPMGDIQVHYLIVNPFPPGQ